MFTPQESIKAYIEAMIDELKDAAPSNTGTLADSIQLDLDFTEEGYNVGVGMAIWGIFLDKGVDGQSTSWGSPYKFNKMPPPSAFDKWVISKGIAPRDEKGRLMKRDAIKFLIARSIFQNGLKPRNWIEPILDSKLEGLANLTAEEIWRVFEEEQNKKR